MTAAAAIAGYQLSKRWQAGLTPDLLMQARLRTQDAACVQAALIARDDYRSECAARQREISTRIWGHPGAAIDAGYRPEEEVRRMLAAVATYLASPGARRHPPTPLRWGPA
jgi:acyl transferase domain-containing protein